MSVQSKFFAPDANFTFNAANAGHARHQWAKIGLLAVSAAGGASAAAVAAVSAVAGYKAVKPNRRVLTDEAEKGLLPPQKVQFNSATSQLKLSGYFYPTQYSQAGIIVCHGFHGGAVDSHKAALLAQRAGYNVLTFDFRGCGESQGQTTSVGFYEVNDLLGAVAYMKTRPEVNPQRIAVYGYSMGGAVAILAAERSNDIQAIVTDSTFASLHDLLRENFRHYYRLPRFPFRYAAVWWSRCFSRTIGKRVEPALALKRIGASGRRIPHLIIHGKEDKGIPVANALRLYEASPGPKYLWIEPDAGHVVATKIDPQVYMRTIDSFLAPVLKRP